MPKEALGVWSPHRDSKSVLAFKSMLGMRAERWLWLNEPDQASWWVVDGTRDNLSELTVNLYREKAQGPVRGVLLAPWCAQHLADHLFAGKALDPEVSHARPALRSNAPDTDREPE